MKLVYLLKYKIVSFYVTVENQLISIVYLGPASYCFHYLVYEWIFLLDEIVSFIETWNCFIYFSWPKTINFSSLSWFCFRLFLYSLLGILIDYFLNWNCFIYRKMKLFYYCYYRKPINFNSVSCLHCRPILYSLFGT